MNEHLHANQSLSTSETDEAIVDALLSYSADRLIAAGGEHLIEPARLLIAKVGPRDGRHAREYLSALTTLVCVVGAPDSLEELLTTTNIARLVSYPYIALTDATRAQYGSMLSHLSAAAGDATRKAANEKKSRKEPKRPPRVPAPYTDEEIHNSKDLMAGAVAWLAGHGAGVVGTKIDGGCFELVDDEVHFVTADGTQNPVLESYRAAARTLIGVWLPPLSYQLLVADLPSFSAQRVRDTWLMALRGRSVAELTTVWGLGTADLEAIARLDQPADESDLRLLRGH